MRAVFNNKHDMRAEGDDVLIHRVSETDCLACAPCTAVPSDVAEAVAAKIGVQVRLATYRPGSSSPTPCQHDGRRHHLFLMYR